MRNKVRQKNKPHKKTTIRKRLTLPMVVFTILLLTISGSVIRILSDIEITGIYKKMAFSYTRAAADIIDGDKISQYIETKEKDDYYFEIQQYLDSMQNESDIQSFRVFVPRETDMICIWSAVEGSDSDDAPTGYAEEYSGIDNFSLREFTKDPPENFTGFIDEDSGNYWAAFSPIFDSSGEPVAVTAVYISMGSLDIITNHFLKNLLTVTLILTLITFLLIYININTGIVKPVRLLTGAVSDMVSNIDSGKDFSVDIHTHDEIETLADAFDDMDKELRNYIRENALIIAQQERVNAELDMASAIQLGSLPGTFPAFPDRDEFDIYASMEPAKEVGGDFYDFFMIDEDHLGIVIADVSGKGIPAAMFMMFSKAVISSSLIREGSPAKALEAANSFICANNKKRMFLTAWLAVLEISTGKLTASNAAHEYPIVGHNGSCFIYQDKHGIPVGIKKKAKYSDYELELKAGDSILVYTDGVAEAADADGEFFGTERILKALNSCTAISPEEILSTVKASVDAFVEGEPQFDDLTMLGLKFTGKGFRS